VRCKQFKMIDNQGHEIFVYKWLPESSFSSKTKAVVQIAHDLAEHAGRYERLAYSLTAAGYVVYANDHRGHGRTGKSQEGLGYAGEDGFNWMVRNLSQLTHRIKTEHPGLPIIFLGHSMGSILAQSYITKYAKDIDGLILSGTHGRQGSMLSIATLLAKREVKKRGAKTPSIFLHNLVFKDYNKAFLPARTDFDWLSRDPEEVDKYINDPFCGGISSAGMFYDLFCAIKEMHKKKNMHKIPKDLQIHIIWGEKDPVGREGKTIFKLIREYERLGIKNLSYKFYKGGRHEMLNETNRAVVTEDLINWLDSYYSNSESDIRHLE